MEEWEPVFGFENYSISNHGRVRNESTGRIMSLTLNGRGIVQAGMVRDSKQHKRSVTVLVAKTFLDPPFPETFDTPINLDGDRLNNHVDNLMWRPRWFAYLYHGQFKRRYQHAIRVPIVDMKTGDTFSGSIEACMQYGLLEKELVLSMLNATYVWPTYQQFAILAE